MGLYVSEITPISRYKRRVVVSDTESNKMYEMFYGEDVSNDWIRKMAPMLAAKTGRKRK